MIDIYAGIAIMSAASVLLVIVGERLGRRWPRRRTILLVATTVTFMLLFARLLLDSAWMLRLVPFSNAIVVANWQLPAAGLIIGLAWHLLPRPLWRKLLLLIPLAGLAIYRFSGPLLGNPPQHVDNRWSSNVCLQSSFSTCGAAAAATLLRAAGIEANETEMAALCFTRPQGTAFHGLYRGLKLKTADTPWRVEIITGSTNALRRSDTPVLLNAGLPRNPGKIDPRYERDWGWTPGTSHSVVLFGCLPDGKLDIGDPAVGREQWFSADLDALWQGQALRLVKR